MRVKISVKGTHYLNADGTLSAPLESPEELAELSNKAQLHQDDSQVSASLKHFRKHRDLEPLVALLLEENPGILRNRDALELLADAARGELRKGRGRVKSANELKRDRKIAACAYWLRQSGMPLKNNPDKSRNGQPQVASACRLIGERLNLSEDAIYSTTRIIRYKPPAFEILPWRLLEESPTPESVLRHYLPTKNEAVPRYSVGSLWCLLRPSILQAARRAFEAKGTLTSSEG